MAAEQQLLAVSSKAPPRAWVLIADWSNFIAGLLLMCAFFFGALIFDQGVTSLSALPGSWFQFFFCAEGVMYALGLFFMIPIMAKSGNALGTMQFAILFAGGIFFSLSGVIVPACIVHFSDIFSCKPCVIAGGTPMCLNAVAHFGITCFMIGTTIGQAGVMGLPKNKFISPFWGSTFYLLGAWTIGIFKFWGPVLCGGFMSGFSTLSTWPWWVALIGAFFLTMGALIFGLMDGSFGLRCH